MDDDALAVATQANYICCVVLCLPSFGNSFFEAIRSIDWQRKNC